MADINPDALRLARINASMAGLGSVQACQSDLMNSLDGMFALIVANPPYLADPLGRTYRNGSGPLGAGLSLEIVKTATERQGSWGTQLLFTGVAIIDGTDTFLTEAAAILQCAGLYWQATELDPDVFGEELDRGCTALANRIAVLCLTATRRT